MFNGSSTAIWPRFVCIEYINTFALNDIQTFLAVQDSSIGDLVTHSLTPSEIFDF